MTKEEISSTKQIKKESKVLNKPKESKEILRRGKALKYIISIQRAFRHYIKHKIRFFFNKIIKIQSTFRAFSFRKHVLSKLERNKKINRIKGFKVQDNTNNVNAKSQDLFEKKDMVNSPIKFSKSPTKQFLNPLNSPTKYFKVFKDLKEIKEIKESKDSPTKNLKSSPIKIKSINIVSPTINPIMPRISNSDIKVDNGVKVTGLIKKAKMSLVNGNFIYNN